MRSGPAGLAAMAALLGLTMTTQAGAAGGFKLPASHSRTLSNGLELYAMEYHELPLVELQVVIRAGAADDPAGREGLADIVADLLRRGAGSRSARDIADTVDFVGGSVGCGADQDATRLSAEFLTKDADLALELVGDLLMRPSFADEEVQRIKGETLSELKAARENPGLMAGRRFIELLYKGHPYGHPTVGSEDSVAAITREDVRRFYEAHYAPGNAILVAVGDFKAPEMLARLESRFAGWSGRAAARRKVPEPRPASRRAIYLVDKPESTQSQIRIGGVGIRRTDPDFPALQVANTILGGSFTSRLVEEIRVNRGLSYSASSRFFPLVESGPFVVNTFTKNETTKETIDVALRIVEGFLKDGPTEEEMDKARRYMKGSFAIGHQSPEAMGAALGEIAFYGLPADYYDTWLDKVAAVTAQDVRRVAGRFPIRNCLILVLGEAAAIRKDLESLGSVQLIPYDSQP